MMGRHHSNTKTLILKNSFQKKWQTEGHLICHKLLMNKKEVVKDN